MDRLCPRVRKRPPRPSARAAHAVGALSTFSAVRVGHEVYREVVWYHDIVKAIAVHGFAPRTLFLVLVAKRQLQIKAVAQTCRQAKRRAIAAANVDQVCAIFVMLHSSAARPVTHRACSLKFASDCS